MPSVKRTYIALVVKTLHSLSYPSISIPPSLLLRSLPVTISPSLLFLPSLPFPSVPFIIILSLPNPHPPLVLSPQRMMMRKITGSSPQTIFWWWGGQTKSLAVWKSMVRRHRTHFSTINLEKTSKTQPQCIGLQFQVDMLNMCRTTGVST